MKTIVIDAGHGGSDRANRGPTGFIEADGNLSKALHLRDYLLATYDNIKILMTRTSDTTISLTGRGRLGAGADLFISIHSNAWKSDSRGSEVFYSVDIPSDRLWAAKLSALYASAWNTVDRGAKVRESTKYPGEDYYTVIDQAQDSGCKHVFLTEDLFHSNPAEEAKLKTHQQAEEYARITGDIIAEILDLPNKKSKDENNMLEKLAELDEAGVLDWLLTIPFKEV